MLCACSKVEWESFSVKSVWMLKNQPLQIYHLLRWQLWHRYYNVQAGNGHRWTILRWKNWKNQEEWITRLHLVRQLYKRQKWTIYTCSLGNNGSMSYSNNLNKCMSSYFHIWAIRYHLSLVFTWPCTQQSFLLSWVVPNQWNSQKFLKQKIPVIL